MSASEIKNLQPHGFPPLPSGWKTEGERFLDHTQRLQLFGTSFVNTQTANPKTLMVVHGQGEHFGRYQHLPHYFAAEVGQVVGCDLLGHGRSEGTRGHIDQFDDYALDLISYIRRWNERLKKQFGKSDIHLVGHSMGGLVALRALLAEPEINLSSVTLVAPFLGLLDNVPIWKKLAAQALNRVAGKIQIANTVDPKVLSHDPEVAKMYDLDHLNHNKVTPIFYFSLLDTIAKTHKVLEQQRQDLFKLPLQFLLPLEDKVVDVQSSIRFAEKLKHPNKRVLIYEGLYHEALNETSKGRVVEDIKTWITEHSSLR